MPETAEKIVTVEERRRTRADLPEWPLTCPEHEHVFVCIAPFCWAVGPTAEEAINECNRIHHPPAGEWLVRIVPADQHPYVNNYGHTFQYAACPWCGQEIPVSKPKRRRK